MQDDEIFMQRALDLAKLGAGTVAPNPMVGAVIVHDDKIIGEGFHINYGEAHAEVNALNTVTDLDKLTESCIYINLEPCSHYGKTPPCCDLLIEKGLRRVVVGCVDSHNKVAGAGIKALEQAGVEVTVGVLELECLELNRRFFTFHNKKRPYVILKWAQSSNGFIDIDRTKEKQRGIFWISQPETKSLTHKWRHEEHGILVGRNTVANDNPELTCREMMGISPHRIVIDPELKLDYGAFHVGDRKVQTYILTDKEVKSAGMLQFIRPDSFEIKDILTKLHELKILSVLVEGGKDTLQRFIDSGLWDEARILSGIDEISKGVPAPKISGQKQKGYHFGKDAVEIIRNA
jgi:diaminohydroxyphosphoribosylaminopyrimidine deaminase / 5-amino-6-(5-phosphoribosylamino)uracil reductase